MWRWVFLAVLLVFIIIAAAVLVLMPAPQRVSAPTTSTQMASSSLDDLITVTAPTPNARVAPPLPISGEARGGWYFEASAPVELRKADGMLIAQGHITAQGDWMTANYVPFTATLSFPPQPAGSAGTLVLKNDNPSGDPANQKTLRIPVTF